MADGRPNACIVAVAVLLCLVGGCQGVQQYLGKFLGKLSELHHGVSGEVYAVDARTLHLKDFTYDGEGPAAYFWVGSTRTPGASGFRVRDENGSGAVLKRYRRKSVTITLPDGKTLNNIKWFSVWCEEFAVNFGDVKIPRNFDYPKPQKIEPLRGVHGISSDNIVIVDAQTLLIPNLSYDGEAPDAKFWVGRGTKPGPQGVRVPDENGKEIPLRRYDRKTVVLTLPGDLTVFDIGHFGIWCEAFTVDFGHVRIPQQMNVPPSLKMLGVSPQSKLNCEVLYDELAFEVRWAVAGESIVLQLVAKLDDGEYMSFGLSGDDRRAEMVGGDVVVAWVDRATLKGYAEDYYLAAKSQCSGPSGSCPDEKLAENTNNIRLLNAAMVNGYSIVTYQRPLKPSDELDRQILTNQSQAIIWAVGPLNQRNEVSFHSHYTKKDQFIEFGRPAHWNCPMPESDSAATPAPVRIPAQVQTPPPPPVQRRRPEATTEKEVVETNTRGRGNERRRGNNREVSERRRDQQISERGSSRGGSRGDDRAGLKRRGTVISAPTAVAIPSTSTSRPVPTPRPVANRNAWHIPPIECYEPDDGVFYAQMGPTGGKRGYPAITGHVGWGISWYINGLLIPEINVVRGKMYTFVVEGGLDPDVPAKYHPFYITDDPIGGYEHKTPEEKSKVRIFAGVSESRSGAVTPNGVGRLCHWTHTGDRDADEFPSFGAFQRTLELRCDAGEPGIVTWTPDANTPDTVYYQCFTHRYLGWKINVVDSCDEPIVRMASEPEPVLALPEGLADNGDLKSSPSIIVETRIKPNDLFQTTQTKQISDRPGKSDGPTTFPDSDNSYQPGPDIITLQPDQNKPQQSFRHPTNKYKINADGKLSDKNQFKSSPELFYGPAIPFQVVDSSSYKSENLTMTTPKNDMSSTEAGSADVSTSTPVMSTSSFAKPPTKHNPAPGPFSLARRPQKPIHAAGKIPPRRPISYNRPPFVIKPSMSMHRPPPQGPYKKSFYRVPLRKRPAIRPIPHMHQKISRPKPANQESAGMTKYQQIMLKSSPQPSKLSIESVSTTAQTASTVPIESHSSELISIKKDYSEQQSTMRPAVNTGFHPESVVIEGGFKPIVTKEFEDRMSENESENTEEIGVIKVNSEHVDKSEQFTETFEPIFVPSPPDSQLLHSKKINKRRPITKKNPPLMFVVKHVARSAEPEDLAEDDEIAMAAERVEAYYLPPDDKKTKPVDRVRKPSNIDIPPGTVVTYDGKTVSGVSLTAPVPEPGSYESRSSKAAELLRLSPQFGPFRGEIPPLDPQNINVANLPQLSSQSVINRDLNAPAASPAAGAPAQSTRLMPVRTFQRATNVRTKREAHHTPEHTAEQEKQRHEEHDEHEHDHNSHGHDHEHNSGNTALLSNYNLLFVIAISLMLRLKYFHF